MNLGNNIVLLHGGGTSHWLQVQTHTSMGVTNCQPKCDHNAMAKEKGLLLGQGEYEQRADSM